MQNHQEEIHIKINKDEHFSTPIWHVKEELPSGAYEWALEVQRNIPSTQKSNVGGYQSESLLDWTPMKYSDHILKLLKFLPKFYLANWWININKKGNYNDYHSHPNSDLACVWYITDNFGSIDFKNPLEFERHNLLMNMGKLGNIKYTCTAGDLLIFPSDLIHRVKPHRKDTLRISVSFNLVLSGGKTDLGIAYFS